MKAGPQALDRYIKSKRGTVCCEPASQYCGVKFYYFRILLYRAVPMRKTHAFVIRRRPNKQLMIKFQQKADSENGKKMSKLVPHNCIYNTNKCDENGKTDCVHTGPK